MIDFVVETNQQGEQARHAAAVLHAAARWTTTVARDIGALLAAHPRREEGAEIRDRLDERGYSLWPCVHRSGCGASPARAKPAPCWPSSR